MTSQHKSIVPGTLDVYPVLPLRDIVVFPRCSAWRPYTARAILHGKGGDVWEMLVRSIPLIPSDETEIASPVFSEDSDNV